MMHRPSSLSAARARRILLWPAVLALAGFGVFTAGSASAGTYTAGSWTLVAPGGATYDAHVLQPINSDGSSVFNHKSSTIPVQYKVTKATSFVFESVVAGDSGVTPTADTAYSLAYYPMGAGVTVKDLTGLTADFGWTYGQNHGGGLRWQIGTPSGNIMVDYGNAATSLQGGTAGSGINMINSPAATENRCETDQVGALLPKYAPWSDVVANYGNLTVNNVVLALDGGWGGDQILSLTDATVTYSGGSSTFTMPAATSPTQTNADPAWIYLYKSSGSTPGEQISETLITSTQGDSGGKFRQVDSKYIYNLPVSNLPDQSATYQVGISFNSDGSNPVGVVQFGLK